MAKIPVEEFKEDLRRTALAKRDALAPADRAAAAQAIADRYFPVQFSPGTIVSGYSPLQSEINPVPLMRKLVDAGAQLALPVVVGRGSPLIMRAFAFGAAARHRRLGHPRAAAGCAGGLSRHHAGAAGGVRSRGPSHRLWRRLLRHDHRPAARAQRAIIAIGLAFAVQEVAVIPVTPRDARLDLVLTEREVIDCRRK